MTQPYVVDLLASFCYSSAYNQRLREYPTGMSLAVPAVVARRTNYQPSMHHRVQQLAGTEAAATNAEPVQSLIDVKFDLNRHEVVFNASQEGCPVRKGDWVVVTTAGTLSFVYRKITREANMLQVNLQSIIVSRTYPFIQPFSCPKWLSLRKQLLHFQYPLPQRHLSQLPLPRPLRRRLWFQQNFKFTIKTSTKWITFLRLRQSSLFSRLCHLF
jgi:hypothetical protein